MENKQQQKATFFSLNDGCVYSILCSHTLPAHILVCSTAIIDLIAKTYSHSYTCILDSKLLALNIRRFSF